MTMMKRFPLVAGALGYAFFLRPQFLKWGTRLGESQRLLPGDDLIPKPNFQATNAVNIDAPPEAVWPWIAQMGRKNTGYYGFDLLTNNGIPSVTFIRKDIAAPEVEMDMDGGFHIIALEENRELLFGGFSVQQFPGVVQDVSGLYLLERRRDGSTRLVVRRRMFSYGALGTVHNVVFEPLYFMFVMQQLNQIKQYAENMVHLSS